MSYPTSLEVCLKLPRCVFTTIVRSENLNSSPSSGFYIVSFLFPQFLLQFLCITVYRGRTVSAPLSIDVTSASYSLARRWTMWFFSYRFCHHSQLPDNLCHTSEVVLHGPSFLQFHIEYNLFLRHSQVFFRNCLVSFSQITAGSSGSPIKYRWDVSTHFYSWLAVLQQYTLSWWLVLVGVVLQHPKHHARITAISLLSQELTNTSHALNHTTLINPYPWHAWKGIAYPAFGTYALHWNLAVSRLAQ